MASVKFDRSAFEREIKITDEIKEKINLFGTHLENLDDLEIELEILPNRPDLISFRNFMRSFKAFLGKEKFLKKYDVKKPDSYSVVNVSQNVKNIRPFTACAIVRGLKFDSVKIKEIIDVQEKLHATLGRNRKKLAIGIYPLEKIKLPISYDSLPPEKIKFIPLESHKEMSGAEILKKHPSGKEFAHLLEGRDRFPVFIDAAGKILSMPPIINSEETGRIDEKTRDVFLECSGFDFHTLQKTIVILSTMLAEMGGIIQQMKLNYDGGEFVTPDFTPKKMKISVENANRLLGSKLKESDLPKLFQKMEYEYKGGVVSVPPWRTDVLHEVDLIEDLAISHGYENFSPQLKILPTIGKESQESKLKNKISELLCGLGFIENISYHLVKKEELAVFNTQEKIEVENSKTEYRFLRPNILIPTLRIFSENKDHDYPQNVFEIGTVFSIDKDKKTETNIQESENLLAACSPGNFTKSKQILEYLFGLLQVNHVIQESKEEGLVDGRTAGIFVNGKKIGYFGEMHPETLKKFNIKMPISLIEISLEKVFEKI